MPTTPKTNLVRQALETVEDINASVCLEAALLEALKQIGSKRLAGLVITTLAEKIDDYDPLGPSVTDALARRILRERGLAIVERVLVQQIDEYLNHAEPITRSTSKT